MNISFTQNVLIAISAEGDCYIFDFTEVSKVNNVCMHMHAFAAFVCMCVCVRACVRACVRVCVCERERASILEHQLANRKVVGLMPGDTTLMLLPRGKNLTNISPVYSAVKWGPGDLGKQMLNCHCLI